jgi:hypothetical protein
MDFSSWDSNNYTRTNVFTLLIYKLGVREDTNSNHFLGGGGEGVQSCSPSKDITGLQITLKTVLPPVGHRSKFSL